MLAGVFGGVASASNGDPNGSKTGTDVTNLVPVEKQSTQTDPTPEDVAAQTEKNRVAINITWLMVGGVLVLFMQAGFALGRDRLHASEERGPHDDDEHGHLRVGRRGLVQRAATR